MYKDLGLGHVICVILGSVYEDLAPKARTLYSFGTNVRGFGLGHVICMILGPAHEDLDLGHVTYVVFVQGGTGELEDTPPLRPGKNCILGLKALFLQCF